MLSITAPQEETNVAHSLYINTCVYGTRILTCIPCVYTMCILSPCPLFTEQCYLYVYDPLLPLPLPLSVEQNRTEQQNFIHMCPYAPLKYPRNNKKRVVHF
jgi:hypothetical protein